MTLPSFPVQAFEDVLNANVDYSRDFSQSSLTGTARRGLAIITCMDSRISPLALVGMQPGDAKIPRTSIAQDLRITRLHADQGKRTDS